MSYIITYRDYPEYRIKFNKLFRDEFDRYAGYREEGRYILYDQLDIKFYAKGARRSNNNWREIVIDLYGEEALQFLDKINYYYGKGGIDENYWNKKSSY